MLSNLKEMLSRFNAEYMKSGERNKDDGAYCGTNII